jgi:GR25 family glycosyltransferase involved in LPS biosynthesis
LTQAFLINLLGDQERKRKSLESWPYQDININVVEAVDQKTLVADYVTSGVAAIWESHKKVMWEFLKSDAKYAIVLEDDFEIVDRPAVLNALTQIELLNADFIQLGFLITGLDTWFDKAIKNSESAFFRITAKFIKAFHKESKLLSRMRVKDGLKVPQNLIPYHVLPGAHAYIVSRKFAGLVSGGKDPQLLAADNFYMALAPMRSMVMYRLRTSAVKQRNVESTVSERFRET